MKNAETLIYKNQLTSSLWLDILRSEASLLPLPLENLDILKINKLFLYSLENWSCCWKLSILKPRETVQQARRATCKIWAMNWKEKFNSNVDKLLRLSRSIKRMRHSCRTAELQGALQEPHQLLSCHSEDPGIYPQWLWQSQKVSRHLQHAQRLHFKKVNSPEKQLARAQQRKEFPILQHPSAFLIYLRRK